MIIRIKSNYNDIIREFVAKNNIINSDFANIKSQN